jgi:hypothetical protein
MTKEAKEQSVEIAAYDTGKFPETQEESTELGMDIVQKQTTAINQVISGAFIIVFGKPITDVKLTEIVREGKAGPDAAETLTYEGTPFLELGEMEESFEEKNGTEHMIINQKYRVLA